MMLRVGTESEEPLLNLRQHIIAEVILSRNCKELTYCRIERVPV